MIATSTLVIMFRIAADIILLRIMDYGMVLCTNEIGICSLTAARAVLAKWVFTMADICAAFRVSSSTTKFRVSAIIIQIFANDRVTDGLLVQPKHWYKASHAAK